MTRAVRRRAALIPLLLLAAACGRLVVPASGGDATLTSPLPPPDGPEITAWTGGDPTWSFPQRETERLLSTYELGSDLEGYPAMSSDACYFGDPEESHLPAEQCVDPVLRQLGVSDDAIRFYRENGLIVYEWVGDGPVKVARVSWGPWGAQDTTAPAFILVPGGFMHATSIEWNRFAGAMDEARAADVFARIRAATGDPGLDLGTEIGTAVYLSAPARTVDGWEVGVTMQLLNCMACDQPFAARVAIGFTAAGVPEAVRFNGFCHFDYTPTDFPPADPVAFDALKAELPLCESPLPGDSIDWTTD